MKKKHILFVCTANQQRSPAAEDLFKHNEKYSAKSAGINSLAKTQVTEELIKWSDIIICMEKIHKKFILKRSLSARDKEIIVLNIPDIYYREDPLLLSLLKKKLKKFL